MAFESRNESMAELVLEPRALSLNTPDFCRNNSVLSLDGDLGAQEIEFEQRSPESPSVFYELQNVTFFP